MTPTRKHSKKFYYTIGLLFILLVESTDLLTGPDISFSIFYLFVSAYFTWFLGLWPGIIASIGLGILSVVTDYYSGFKYSHIAIPFWTALMRSGIFMIVAFILNRLQISERNLKESIKSLQESNNELDRFTSMVSHDLRGPLQTIGMFCHLLEKRSWDKGDDQKEYLKHIQDSIKRMNQLVSDLLSYAKVSNVAESVPLNLRELIIELTKDLEAHIKKKNAKIVIKELPIIQANPVQMRQLFQNLIDNALKYSKEQVPVYVEIGSRKDEQMVEIYVRDNGIGFDEQYLDKVFMPFQRLHHYIEGTGIGLPTCKRIVEQHGGKILARSKPGEGSIFIVRLPLTDTILN